MSSTRAAGACGCARPGAPRRRLLCAICARATPPQSRYRRYMLTSPHAHIATCRRQPIPRRGYSSRSMLPARICAASRPRPRCEARSYNRRTQMSPNWPARIRREASGHDSHRMVGCTARMRVQRSASSRRLNTDRLAFPARFQFATLVATVCIRPLQRHVMHITNISSQLPDQGDARRGGAASRAVALGPLAAYPYRHRPIASRAARSSSSLMSCTSVVNSPYHSGSASSVVRRR